MTHAYAHPPPPHTRPRSDESVVQEMVELPNGCICCTVKDRRGGGSERLSPPHVSQLPADAGGAGDASRSHRLHPGGDDWRVRRLFIAPLALLSRAGLADPGPVAQALWADEAVEPGCVLDGVVTVVDALHFRRQLAEAGGEAALQVAYADLVLLNKADLVVRYSASQPL